MELRWLEPFTADDKSAFDHIIRQSGVDVNDKTFFGLFMNPVEEQPSTLPPAPPGYHW